jgi:hypothetical protein
VAAALAAGVLLLIGAAPARSSAGPPEVQLVFVRGAVDVERLAADGMAVGLLSAGIGEVPAERTQRDISAGSREPPPSDAVPGLLQSTLERAGLADRFRTSGALPSDLERLVRGLGDDDLLIAVGAPPPAANRALPIGIAGSGFAGRLTSDSTRTAGYVLSTDIAPTVLRRFGLALPSQIDGQPIRAQGAADPRAVDRLGDRLAAIPDRRGPVLVGAVAVWILIAVMVALLVPPARRAAAAWLALALAYLPLLLLAGAALRPGALAEGVLVAVGAAGSAGLTLALLRGWSALATACAITVVAYAIDVVAGSGLTRLSLLGPNPIHGARFFGIGNELEALLAVMVPVGVGAGLAARSARGRGGRTATGVGAGPTAAGEGRRLGRRFAIAAFLVAGFAAAFVFGAGRFGADVGAAIVLPVGAAVAGAAVSRRDFVDFSAHRPEEPSKLRRIGLAGAVAAPLIALVVLALIDLASGADAHLTRSVLDAGGPSELADSAERRLRLSGDDFAQSARQPLFWLVVAGLVLAVWQRRRIGAWLGPVPAVRAGLAGACAAVALGVLVNDSGGTFLALGGLALIASLAYAWAQAGLKAGEARVTSATKPEPP